MNANSFGGFVLLNNYKMKSLCIMTIIMLFSFFCRAQLSPVFSIDTSYTSYDSLNSISIFHHTIRKVDGSKPLDKSTATSIWKTTDSVKYFDKTNFLFMTKTTVTRQHECILMNSFETATIYDPSGTYKTFVKEDDKKKCGQALRQVGQTTQNRKVGLCYRFLQVGTALLCQK